MNRLIPLLLLLLAMPSMAARQFDIEVIMFKRAVDAEKVSESWPNSLPPLNFARAGSFADVSFRQSKGVILLPSSAYQLNEQAQKLSNHAGFTVLLHTAWRQNDQGRQAAPVFHIQAGQDFADQFQADGNPIGSRTSDAPIDGVTEMSIAKPLYELDGTLQIYVQHFLFAEALLDLKKPAVREVTLQDAPLQLSLMPEEQDATVQAGLLEAVSPQVQEQRFLKSYRLDQKRRMRSGETHYLDHPLMGVIIQVRRVAE
ncbi:MAG: peptidoglycan binding protein CsiV [Vibrio sp.]|uniref:Peptidoglycan binding protein CsiV n=1 Tax=Vibrio chanodichtyis TaxID=3027932 RepID=A0ABT5UWI9_9VIBR|nr:peptidoglycan binding protein CsiV [Vibrio chanodichtyis]MDE1513588.1 peptidoglycan binding protein CsiV [Vibrio chanodichtyis]